MSKTLSNMTKTILNKLWNINKKSVFPIITEATTTSDEGYVHADSGTVWITEEVALKQISVFKIIAPLFFMMKQFGMFYCTRCYTQKKCDDTNMTCFYQTSVIPFESKQVETGIKVEETGMNQHREDNKTIAIKDSMAKKIARGWKRHFTKCIVWASIIMFLQFIYLLRSFTAFTKEDKFGPQLFLKIFTTLWLVKCFLLTMVVFYVNSQSKVWQFFNKWEVVLHKEYWHKSTNEKIQNYKNLKMAMYFVVVLTLVEVAANVYMTWHLITLNNIVEIPLENNTLTSYKMIANSSMVMNWISPLPVNPTNGKLMMGFHIFEAMSLKGSECLSMAVFMITCFILHQLFNNLAAGIKSKTGHEIIFDIKTIRKKYNDLVELTGIANDMFKCITGVEFFFDVCIGCLIAYNILVQEIDAHSMAYGLFWLSGELLCLGIIATAASLVNAAVSISCFVTQ